MTAFTVVMAAFNTRATIGSAIRSVLAQTRGDFELIVVDDGSSDGTPEVVRGFASDERVRLVEAEHGGAAAARGAGIAAGGAPLVSLIDSDDLWMPRYLETMGVALEADPGASFAYTDAWYLDERTHQIRRASAMAFQRPPEPVPESAGELFAALLERNFIYNAVTLRRTAIEAVGPPDARLRSSIDWEWWLRFSAHGHRAARVPGRLAVYRIRDESMTRDTVRAATGRRDLMRIAAAEYPGLPEETRVELRRRADRYDAVRASLTDRSVIGTLRRLRLWAGATKTRLLHRRTFHPEPPAEVREAFGDLRAI